MARTGLAHPALGRPAALLMMLPLVLSCTPAGEPATTAGLAAASSEAVGRLAVVEGFGVMDPERGDLIRTDAIFRIYCMTCRSPRWRRCNRSIAG